MRYTVVVIDSQDGEEDSGLLTRSTPGMMGVGLDVRNGSFAAHAATSVMDLNFRRLAPRTKLTTRVMLEHGCRTPDGY